MAADGRKTEPAGHGAKTEAVRERAIVALLSEPTIEQAARHATFQAALSRIPALTVRAVDTFADLLGATKHPAVRLGAARTVAEIGMHQHDAETILRKLDDLEASQRRR